jgi:hypothetical protein
MGIEFYKLDAYQDLVGRAATSDFLRIRRNSQHFLLVGTGSVDPSLNVAIRISPVSRKSELMH